MGKLGEEWVSQSKYRRLKEPGSVKFHIINLDYRKTVTFFDENKKPIRESDPTFASRMEAYKKAQQIEWDAKSSGATEEEVKKLHEETYKVAPSEKYHFDIINRDTQDKEILEMSPGAAKKLNGYFLKGYTNVSHDFILENTGKVGVNKFEITPAVTKAPLTEKELKSLEDAPADNTVDPDEIPF